VEELRVPKRRVPVEIVQSGGAVRRVTVFLAENAHFHVGPETLGDLLNGGEEFIPAFDEEARVMTFLNRRSVALARVANEVEAQAGGAEDVTIPVEHQVEITLVDGSRLEGIVSYVRPGQGRLVEFLNERELFFRLLERDRTALVGRHHVARVALTSE